MPQMSPMMWMIFPFVMIFLVVVMMTTLNEELNMVEVQYDKDNLMKGLKW